MLEQPWPPPAPGPQQPRDAHGEQWANDVRRLTRRPVRAAGRATDFWSDLPGREPVARRRAGDDVRGHEPAAPPAGERHGRPLVARWQPQEEWIPDPTPSPEQRWSPEQDWLSAFADVAPATPPVTAGAPRSTRRWWLLAAAVPVVGAVVGLVLALL